MRAFNTHPANGTITNGGDDPQAGRRDHAQRAFGAKSVAEIGINAPLPTLSNAVYDAVGIRLTRPPFTPEKVWAALHP